ncbi:MAG: hypothetical protein Q7K44_02285 [Candidatus Liptonbacteria bacterium]|nr:hypothetical protein [Candidatus Liptonbacteria bacterium]
MNKTFSWFDPFDWLRAHHKLGAKVLQSVFIVAGLFTAAVVFAQTVTSDIPQDLLPVAKELGCDTKAACEMAFSANLSKGIEIAERHKVYDKNPEIKKLASTFKQEVLSKLTLATEGNFEETIVKIAKDLIQKQPSLAEQLSVTSQEVNAADTIVKEVKKEGVDLSICRKPADSLTREQLVSCLNATKRLAEQKDTVKTYITDKRIEASASNDSTLKLDEAIANGEYNQLGAKNAEELGVICLRPGSPAACDQIASRFFGQEGVKMLAQARQQVSSAETKYRNVTDNFTLTTPDGKVFSGKDAIKGECERAFDTRNVELAKACGQFAVKNGFATDADVQDGLKFIQSIQGNVDLNQCRTNPQACEQFIPQEKKGDFTAFQQVGEIMKTEIGFDPRQCEQGASNPEIGQRCFDGSKNALPKLEELAKTSPAIQNIVNDIKRNISESQKFEDKRVDIQKTFQSQQGGPGGCKSADECFKYCSDATNGPECISFGAKQGIFSGNEAVSRFQEYNQNIDSSSFYTSSGFQSQPRQGQSQQGQGGAGNKEQPRQPSPQGPNQGPVPPGQTSGFTQPGPGFGPPPGQFGQSGSGGGGFGGPSPECFAAIQSGDFVKAKTLCAPPTVSYPGQTQGQTQSGQYSGQGQEQTPGQQYQGQQNQQGQPNQPNQQIQPWADMCSNNTALACVDEAEKFVASAKVGSDGKPICPAGSTAKCGNYQQNNQQRQPGQNQQGRPGENFQPQQNQGQPGQSNQPGQPRQPGQPNQPDQSNGAGGPNKGQGFNPGSGQNGNGPGLDKDNQPNQSGQNQLMNQNQNGQNQPNQQMFDKFNQGQPGQNQPMIQRQEREGQMPPDARFTPGIGPNMPQPATQPQQPTGIAPQPSGGTAPANPTTPTPTPTPPNSGINLQPLPGLILKVF